MIHTIAIVLMSAMMLVLEINLVNHYNEPLLDLHPVLLSMTKKEWEKITEDMFRKVFKKSAVKRH